jgi:hypothetical protein
MQSVQAAGVLDERPLPGKRHREEERVPARVVEAFVHEPPLPPRDEPDHRARIGIPVQAIG